MKEQLFKHVIPLTQEQIVRLQQENPEIIMMGIDADQLERYRKIAGEIMAQED